MPKLRRQHNFIAVTAKIKGTRIFRVLQYIIFSDEWQFSPAHVVEGSLRDAAVHLRVGLSVTSIETTSRRITISVGGLAMTATRSCGRQRGVNTKHTTVYC